MNVFSPLQIYVHFGRWIASPVSLCHVSLHQWTMRVYISSSKNTASASLSRKCILLVGPPLEQLFISYFFLRGVGRALHSHQHPSSPPFLSHSCNIYPATELVTHAKCTRHENAKCTRQIPYDSLCLVCFFVICLLFLFSATRINNKWWHCCTVRVTTRCISPAHFSCFIDLAFIFSREAHAK